MEKLNREFRFDSIDQLRGLVIVIMALDHVRDFFSPFSFQPEDLANTTPELFFTRWITHFCAPVFVFLAGMSAYLFGQKRLVKSELRDFLLSRGIWLVFLEVTVVNLSWKFNLAPFVFLQVIWALGMSMIALAFFIYLPRWLCWLFAAAMILGHNLLDPLQAQPFGSFDWLWGILHQQYWIALGQQGAGIFVAYPLIPWVGVMLLGYTSGSWFFEHAGGFTKRAFWVGLSVTLFFIVMRYINIYGDMSPWEIQPRGTIYTIIAFLNTHKYPPSLLYLTMTLGPALVLLSWLHQAKQNRLQWLVTFGRVPFFFYMIHIPLINVVSLVYFNLTIGVRPELQFLGSQKFPDNYQPSLLLTYIAWFVLITVLFYVCRWYVGVKQRHEHWVLKYL